MCTVDRHQGRPRSARMDEITDQRNDMFLSQEDQTCTHSIVCEISSGTGISMSSVVCVVKRICRWNASRSDMCKSWLRSTSPLAWSALSYFWFWWSFPSLLRTSSSSQTKKVLTGASQTNKQNANKWNVFLTAQCNIHQTWLSNIPR